MSLVVFTGGARSGKSKAALMLAEVRALDDTQVVYAVFGRPSDAEMAERIARHRAERPSAFATLEVESADGLAWLDGLGGRAPEESTAEGAEQADRFARPPLLVVDCLGTLLGLVMEEAWRGAEAALGEAEPTVLPEGVEGTIEARIDEIVDALVAREGDTIVVTNEVGLGVVPEWASARLFRDVLGRANRRLTDAADQAYLCVAGRLLALDTLPARPNWPHD